MEKDKRIKKFDRQAKVYANNRSHPKIEYWRSQLIHKAHGYVLEVGVGAGANFPYYDRNNVEVTGVDFSSEMLKQAERTARNYQVRATFLEEDIDKLKFESNTFDSIVSTLTLCTYSDPLTTLNKLNDWCRKDGTILLMEHGLSSHRILSFTQKMINPLFKSISGCHCNRDVIDLLRRSKLEIVHIERHWSDIFYVIEAKPNKNNSNIIFN